MKSTPTLRTDSLLPRISCKAKEARQESEMRHADTTRMRAFSADTVTVSPGASPKSRRARKFRKGEVNRV